MSPLLAPIRNTLLFGLLVGCSASVEPEKEHAAVVTEPLVLVDDAGNGKNSYSFTSPVTSEHSLEQYVAFADFGEHNFSYGSTASFPELEGKAATPENIAACKAATMVVSAHTTQVIYFGSSVYFPYVETTEVHATPTVTKAAERYPTRVVVAEPRRQTQPLLEAAPVGVIAKCVATYHRDACTEVQSTSTQVHVDTTTALPSYKQSVISHDAACFP